MHREDSPLLLAGRPVGEPIWRTVRRDGPWIPPAGGAVGGPAAALAPLVGVERRLVRRAARLWEELRGKAPLPGTDALRHFLGSAFAPSALLVELPVGGPGPCDIRMIGSRLDSLALFRPGPVEPGEGPGAGARLAALARAAQALSRPAMLEIDAPGAVLEERGSGVLLRVVALPFAARPEGVQPVLVIASWRHLLSPDETAALHEELRSAVEALHRLGH